MNKETPEIVESPSILLIDDDFIVLEMMSLMLRNVGFQVVTAMNFAPLNESRLDKFDCIILDIWLSDSYGAESLEVLAEKNYQGALVLISGRPQSEIEEVSGEGLDLGLAVIGHLQKPVVQSDLMGVLSRMQNSHLRSQSQPVQYEANVRHR
jgi:FixJ family two-component response regulator